MIPHILVVCGGVYWNSVVSTETSVLIQRWYSLLHRSLVVCSQSKFINRNICSLTSIFANILGNMRGGKLFAYIQDDGLKEGIVDGFGLYYDNAFCIL